MFITECQRSMIKKKFDIWLDPEFQDTDTLKSLRLPYGSGAMEIFADNPFVGNVKLGTGMFVKPV